MDNFLNPNFVAIDFETSTSYRHSVCQVACVTVIDGKIVNKFSSLVRPLDNEYNGRNIAIHGIHPYHTKDAKSFPEVFNSLILPEIRKVQALVNFTDKYLVAHNAGFDRSVMSKALEFYKLNEIGIVEILSPSVWSCTHLLYRGKGFETTKLNILCEHFKIPLQHHDALSDAYACTYLYLKHLKDLQLIEEKNSETN